jgi:NAD+ diphosphatase
MTGLRPPNPLASIGVDRLGHRRSEAGWVERAMIAGRVDYLPVQGSRNLVRTGHAPQPALLGPAELAELGISHECAILLGTRGERLLFAVAVGEEVEAPPESAFFGLRHLAGQVSRDDAGLLAYARAMVLWHANHQFCSRCGSATRAVDSGHARVCGAQDCGVRHFPRVDPAVIVLVARDDLCLLGRQPGWPEGRYSTIAGFVEPGESLEDAVVREVYEETGIRSVDARYHSSQPWPFPSSLMLGYTATAIDADISLVDGELEDARWVSRDDMAEGRILLPTPMSIAYALVRDWYNGCDGRDLERDAGVHQKSWR